MNTNHLSACSQRWGQSSDVSWSTHTLIQEPRKHKQCESSRGHRLLQPLIHIMCTSLWIWTNSWAEEAQGGSLTSPMRSPSPQAPSRPRLNYVTKNQSADSRTIEIVDTWKLSLPYYHSKTSQVGRKTRVSVPVSFKVCCKLEMELMRERARDYMVLH